MENVPSFNLSVNSAKSLQKNQVSTKELADILGVSNMSIKRILDKTNNLNGTVKVENGKTTYFTEEQVVLIKQELQKHHNLASRQIDDVSTELEENLLIQNALNLLQRRNVELKNQLEAAKPKADYYDNYIESENYIEIGHLGKTTQIGEQKIFKKLLEDGYIKVRYSTDGIKSYDPCYGYEKYFKSIPVTFTTNNHTYSRDKLMLTHKGFVYFNAKYAGPKVLEETAEKFIQKGEAEYQNIVDDTAKKIVENIPGAMSRFVQDAAEICKDYPLNPKGICNNKAE